MPGIGNGRVGAVVLALVSAFMVSSAYAQSVGPDTTGHGIYVWKSDSGNASGHYEGDWVDGKRQGRGAYEWPDGGRYEGEFAENKRNGQGVFVGASGSRYEGDWRNGLRHGRGINAWHNGKRYEGDWRNDVPHGYGVYVWANGARYHGNFGYGRIHGIGTCRSKDGRWGKCEFNNGKAVGWVE